MLRLNGRASEGPDRKRVLVLCTGNSCRSIIAEALINQCRGDRFQAFSAGSRPTGVVHPMALQTLRRHGVEPGNPRSQSWDDYAGQAFDYVITVCASAAAEPCPVFPGNAMRLHWDIPDPAAAEEADVGAAFDTAFEQIRQQLESALP